MAIEIDRGHEKYDVVFGRAVIKAHAVANDYGCAEITWHAPGGATTTTGAIKMTDITRTIQEIFNVAISEAGYSPVVGGKNWAGEGMCAALKRARAEELISAVEYSVAIDEIEGYQKELAGDKFSRPEDHFLTTVLRAAGLPYDERVQRRIYKDWANRPTTGRTS